VNYQTEVLNAVGSGGQDLLHGDGDDNDDTLPTVNADAGSVDVAKALFKVSINHPVPHHVLKYSQLRKLIRAVRSSPQRRRAWLQDIRDYIKHNGGDATDTAVRELMLILDCPTRWGSTHAMMGKSLSNLCHLYSSTDRL
jgi:hypothetical protein